MDRAHSSGQYQPHFQLRSLAPLPSVLRQMHDVLLSRLCQPLPSPGVGLPPLRAPAPLQRGPGARLLGHAAHGPRGRVAQVGGRGPGKVGTGRSRLAQMLSGSGPQWMYGPGGIEGLRALSSAADASADVRGCAEHLLEDARAVVKEAEPPGSPSALPLPSLGLGTPTQGGTSPPDNPQSGDEDRQRGAASCFLCLCFLTSASPPPPPPPRFSSSNDKTMIQFSEGKVGSEEKEETKRGDEEGGEEKRRRNEEGEGEGPRIDRRKEEDNILYHRRMNRRRLSRRDRQKQR